MFAVSPVLISDIPTVSYTGGATVISEGFGLTGSGYSSVPLPPPVVAPAQPQPTPYEAPPVTVSRVPAVGTQTPTGTVFTAPVPQASAPPASRGTQYPTQAQPRSGWDPLTIGGAVLLAIILWRVIR